MKATIVQRDKGWYTFHEGQDIESVENQETIREFRYIEIDEETHKRILSILDNHMILTANLRPIFLKAQP